MRTKTLLLSAAALVAGLVASQAQSNVYSANVVGYATTVYKGNGQFTLVSNPFDNGSGNQLTNVVDGANTLPKQSQVLTWDPVGQSFVTTIKGGSPAVWGSSFPLPPGQGFFVRNGNVGSGAPDVTNVWVGSIVVPNGGFTTNTVGLNYSLHGSPIPYSGKIAKAGQPGGDTNMDFGSVVGKQSQILTWDIVGQSYVTDIKGGSPAVWGQDASANPGDGFFMFNKSGPATNVVENLNLQ